MVQAYESCDAGEVNVKKTFTFGDDALEKLLHDSMEHKTQFVVVGGSFVVDGGWRAALNSRLNAPTNGMVPYGDFGMPLSTGSVSAQPFWLRKARRAMAKEPTLFNGRLRP